MRRKRLRMFPRGQGPDPVRVTVTVECVGCKARKEIGPGDVKPNDVPYCDKCYMPMVAVSAEARRG